MLRPFIIFSLILFMSFDTLNSEPDKATKDFAIVIHGGAGWSRNISEEKQKAIQEGLKQALATGYSILESGGSSLNAIEAAIMILEDNINFNAGKGSVYNAAEKQEMDASIMVGDSQQAGAVASVSRIKNPIKLARYVMENTKHVMMVGEGAEKIAKEGGFELVNPDYFASIENLERLKVTQEKEKLGTVGAVALDQSGTISAGTSTGGMTNKKPGRIGDSPIIGAGTWAQNNVCGVSGTGHGEFFIRYNVAREICARIEYLDQSVEKASSELIQELKDIGADGGVIVLDRNGNVSMVFNTDGMARAYKNSKGDEIVTIY
jgi:beta-aspartyl-peptidase (threonine type)|tara:strand:- start:908 stop:1867 length:960 start_codon:yes stop_codon:yes gene_type:complete